MPNETVAGLLISIDGNTVKLRTEMDRAAASVRQASQKMKADITEARGAIKLAGEEIGINLNRHLVSFLAKLPGVAPAMAAAFSATAVVGIGVAIGESINRLAEWIKKGREAAGVLAEGFADMRQTAKLANDEQAVTNDKLDEEIAKLTGRHPNLLMEELDKARVAADKLVKSLEEANKQQQELLAKGNVGEVKGFFTFTQSTDSTDAIFKHQAEERMQIAERYQDAMDAANSKDEKAKAQASMRAELLEKEKGQLKDLVDLYNYIKHESETRGGSLYGGMDQTAVLTALSGGARQLQQLMRTQTLTFDSEDKGDQVKALHASADAAKAAAEERKKEAEATKAIWLEDQRVFDEIHEHIRVGTDEMVRQDQEAANKEAEAVRRSAAEWWQAHNEQFEGQRQAVAQAYQGLQEQTANEVQAGHESAAQRVAVLRSALEQMHAAEVDAFDREIALHAEGTREYENLLKEREKLDAEYLKQKLALERQAQEMGARGAIDQIEREAADVDAQMKQLILSTTNELNDAILRAMTERDHRGVWKGMGKSVFTSIARTGLQDAEGSLLRTFFPGMKTGKPGSNKGNRLYTSTVLESGTADGTSGGAGGSGLFGGLLHTLGIGGNSTSKPDGSQNNPFYTKSSDSSGGLGSGGMSGPGGLFGGASAGSGGADADSGILGALSGAGGAFMGGMADGGLMQPGGFYLTGERGPELLQVGSTSRINNARDTSRIFSGGGRGGDVHHHWNIDARGSTDPAAVHAAVQRGIRAAAPQIAAGAIAAKNDYDRRRPSAAR